MQTFDIPATKELDAARRIARANKRLKNAGISEQFKVTYAPYTKIVTDKAGIPRSIDRVKVTLYRPAIGYEGYSFLARVEEVSPNNFVAFTAPGVELQGWKPSSMDCEHCNKKRSRSKVYVIEDAAGVKKIVGKTCVELYTGLKPEGLFALEWNEFNDFHNADWEKEDVSYGTPVYSADKILQLAVYFARKYGYRPTSAHDSTKSRILEVITASSAENLKETKTIVSEASLIDVEHYRDAMRQEYSGATSDWATNVMSLLTAEWIDERALGTFASGVSPIIKREKQAEVYGESNDEFFMYPDVKFKVFGSVMEKTLVTDYYGYNSSYYRVTFITDAGYVLVWKTSSSKIPEVGIPLVIFGRVKRHNEWQGKKSTQITRVTFVEC